MSKGTPDNLPAPQEPAPGLVLYQSPDGTTRFQVRLDQETLWLSQRQLAELFQKSVPTINEHIANVFEEGELPPEATIRKFRIVQTEGGREVERLIAAPSAEQFAQVKIVGARHE